ncbi:hypothetical protein H8F21_19195 [Pseudomonas sp. P66]|jgi:hypothetical protein|uniref:Uncharacterized protein n=1 Tax=Pseudomonas arcuscaelestis TaxID=2710591 RepID=A0ABS2C3V6_9PSED|nr:hypothetical protein [Pseudomonas arcuscaelestis]MBM3110468.1 hypothetical protein [Pseudomonas arcuscaelestis]MBM5459694.1 hypothetical protein [Pseudomonas arcuscaelestis]
MNDFNPLQALIVDLAADGIRAIDLKRAVTGKFPALGEAQYQSTLLGLQELECLVGEEVQGDWFFKTLDKTSPDYQPLEYSPEFAEKIIAASCGEFVEIDVDAFLAQLSDMIAKAKSANSKPAD